MFDKALENISDSVSLKGTYLGSDGLLYCSKCNTPRQIKTTFNGKPRVFSCICKCMEQERDEQERQQRLNENQMRILENRKKGLTDEFYLKSTFDQDDNASDKVSQALRRYCDKWTEMKDKNIGLMLWGDVGGGKSFYAACIANKLIDSGEMVIMSRMSALVQACTADYGNKKQEILDKVVGCDLLIIDDLGTERDTPTAYENAFDVIDARYRCGRPLIVTTNLTLKDMANIQGDKSRLYNRVLEMCTPIHVKHENRRIATMKEKSKDAYKELGLIE